MKRTVIWNLKGGQGKTVLSLAIAMLEGAFIVTNDVHSPVDEVLGSERALPLKMTESLPTVPSDVPLIYDFGGYPDARIIDAAKDAEFVVIPIVYESPLEMQVTINAIAEIEKYNTNIIVVINKAGKGDMERAKEVFNSMDIKYPMIEIKKSNAFSRAVEQKKSLEEMIAENPLLKYHYSKPLEQIRHLISLIS